MAPVTICSIMLHVAIVAETKKPQQRIGKLDKKNSKKCKKPENNKEDTWKSQKKNNSPARVEITARKTRAIHICWDRGDSGEVR